MLISGDECVEAKTPPKSSAEDQSPDRNEVGESDNTHPLHPDGLNGTGRIDSMNAPTDPASESA